MSATLYTSLGIGNQGSVRTPAGRTVLLNIATRDAGDGSTQVHCAGGLAVAGVSQLENGNPAGTRVRHIATAIELD